MELIGWLIVGGFFAGTTYMTIRSQRTYRHWQRIQQGLRATGAVVHWQSPSYASHVPFCVVVPGQAERETWRRGVLVVTDKRLAIYHPTDPDLRVEFACSPEEIEGYWRPVKYEPGRNEMWVHCRQSDRWLILRIRLERNLMMRLARALRTITADELVSAYRRRRPYIHRGPTPAHPARQNLQGAWEMQAPVALYLMPLHLIILRDGVVERQIPLAHIQAVAALPRLDAPDGDGLLRWTVTTTGETLAFALADYAAWAEDLAQAARRTLEAPILRKRKGKDDDEEDDEEAW